MGVTVFDHIVVAILVIVFPILSVTDFRKLESRLNAGEPTARFLFYRSAIAWSWGLTLAVAALWLVYERSIPQIGFSLETGTGFWIGLAITVLACGLALMQPIALRRDQKKSWEVAVRFESIQAMVPRTDREARGFMAVSVTAGVCEEILYRGHLMVYIASIIAIDNMWPAVLLSSLVFGLGHAYQGPQGVLRTGLIGLAAAGLYLLIGSIWFLIVLHTVVDLVSGAIGREVLAD